MTNKKPDGYCAWHPEKGADPLSFSRDELTAWHIRLGIDTDSPYMRERGFDHAAILAAKASGWQIKPVWLCTEPPEEMAREAFEMGSAASGDLRVEFDGYWKEKEK